jgi:ribosomal protein S18 acetylase RimI-like enzyme
MNTPAKIKIEEIKYLLSVVYTSLSHLGEREGNRYVQPIFGDLILTNEEGTKEKTIGRISGYKVLLGNAINDNIGFFDVFDMDTDRYGLGETIFDDFWKKELHPALNTVYEDEFDGSDLLVLKKVEIEPEYRGQSLGKYFIKDFYNNFISGCQLFIADFREQENERIMFYFKRMGFEIIPRVSNQFMFLNPAFKNQPWEGIILD